MALERPVMLPRRPSDALPPHDIAAEEAVIAALMLDAVECHAEGVFTLLDAGDFFREQNGWIFDAARAVFERKEMVTPVTLAHELDRSRLSWTPAEGWLPLLLLINGQHFTAIGASAHARVVAADALYRRLIAAAGQIGQIAYGGTPGDTERVLSLSEELIRRVRNGHENVIPAAHRFAVGRIGEMPR